MRLPVMVFVAFAAFAALIAMAAGCGAFSRRPLPEFRAIVRVESDPGQPMAGAQLEYGKQPIGATDAAGLVELSLRGRDGQVFDLSVHCPKGYASPSKPVAVTVRRLSDVKTLPEYHVQCPPLLRTVVVAVRAVNGPNLPVVFLGRERTRTDASGAAHLVLQVPPNQAVELSLDTGGARGLEPRSPRARFDVRDQDDVFVLEQRFEVERKRRRMGGGRRPPGPRPL
jgi:hypothetical protein